MRLLPDEELQGKGSFQFAPMMDFLFLMMALFAVLAISRSSIFDTDIHLYQRREEPKKTVVSSGEKANISIVITAAGRYKWIAELHQYELENVSKLQQEIVRRYELGLLPKNKEDTKVLLHIDENAPWKDIASAVFAVREIGFSPFPVYKRT